MFGGWIGHKTSSFYKNKKKNEKEGWQMSCTGKDSGVVDKEDEKDSNLA